MLGKASELEPWLSGLILVTCPAEERVRRLVTYRGMQEADAWQRVKAQSDPERKRALASWVIENHGTQTVLIEQVDKIADAIETGAG